jgi:hypothetical protein
MNHRRDGPLHVSRAPPIHHVPNDLSFERVMCPDRTRSDAYRVTMAIYQKCRSGMISDNYSDCIPYLVNPDAIEVKMPHLLYNKLYDSTFFSTSAGLPYQPLRKCHHWIIRFR